MDSAENVLYFGARDHGALWQVVEHRKAAGNIQTISGHARGVDAVAEFTTHSLGGVVTSFPARWKDENGNQNKGAGFDRNKVMVDACTRAVGFLWPGCRGSLHTESLLKKSGKPFEMVEPDLKELGTVLFSSVHRSSRQALPYKGPGAVDVSSRSFSSTWIKFAPSESLLNNIQQLRRKSWRVEDEEERRALIDDSWATYVPAYLQEMRDLYRQDPDAFVGVLKRTNFAVLTCYCPPHHPAHLTSGESNEMSMSRFEPNNIQCHRRLLADIFVKIGARHGLRVLDGGEVGVSVIEESKRHQ